MTAETRAQATGPPHNVAGPRPGHLVGEDREPRSQQRDGSRRSTEPVTGIVAAPPDAVAAYLAELVALCPDPPLIDELAEADLGTARGTASIAQAALAWLRHKRPDVIREQLERELAENDLLARWRVRQAGLDVHGRGSTDWAAATSRPSHAELERRRREPVRVT